MAPSAGRDLPRPFYDNWWRPKRGAARSLWAFHSALTDPTVPAHVERQEISSFFTEEQEAAANGNPLRVVPESVWRKAYQACSDNDLDRDLLGVQVNAAQTFVGSIRFATSASVESFVRQWAAPHGRLLAQLAGHRSSMRRKRVDELARGFFHLGRLLTLPSDVKAERLFLPEEDLQMADVTVADLRRGSVTEGIRRVLWKQSVRVRDALAQGQPLLPMLSFRRRLVLKRYWLGALAYVNELDRRDYDLWTRPLALPWWRRVQVYVQTIFGRTAP